MAMRKIEDRIGRFRIHGLLGVLILLSVNGCDWLFGSSTPTNAERARPGAERQVAPSNALPPAGGGHGYDAASMPVDETRTGPKIGSVIADKGGQKAQIDAANKEAAERDKRAREEREKASQAAAKAKEASTSGDKGAKPPADQPPAQPAAPAPAPVTSAPIAPPATTPPAASPPPDQKS
jgi:hypothetical protein